MSETSLQIYLNSNQATEIYNNNNADCLFYLPLIEIDSQSQLHLCVKNAVIPYTFYNINSNNNRLDWTYDNNTIYTAYLTLGNYNINNFIPMLKNAMIYTTVNNNVVTTHDDFTITYNTITNKLAFQQINSLNFTFLKSSSCFGLIGFNLNNNISSEGGYLQSRTCVNLNSIQCVHVEMNINTNNVSSCDWNNRNIVASIPVDVPPYGVLVHKNGDFFVNTFKNIITELQVTLLDQNGKKLYLNGGQWSMTLQLDIYKFAEE